AFRQAGGEPHPAGHRAWIKPGGGGCATARGAGATRGQSPRFTRGTLLAGAPRFETDQQDRNDRRKSRDHTMTEPLSARAPLIDRIRRAPLGSGDPRVVAAVQDLEAEMIEAARATGLVLTERIRQFLNGIFAGSP